MINMGKKSWFEYGYSKGEGFEMSNPTEHRSRSEDRAFHSGFKKGLRSALER